MDDAELKRLIESVAAETRQLFDVSTEAITREIRQVAEVVVHVDEKVDRHAARLDEKIERGFVETQAMMKFSHAELDRRVRDIEERSRSLEEGLEEVKARVSRLESSTH
jgi:hypothetical protein